ncbi:MAG: thioredoxin family protein [Deltaproteobacteria bacterium]|nr:thioredoxin family protein [Deltaproteobacteria bacterium]
MTTDVFSGLTIEEAVARAMREDRILLVDLTASWCGPCQVMDRTTWRDTAVVSWVHQHAIALKIDVQHHPEKERFRSASLPAVIALRDGEEIDRALGLHDAKQMLGWLEGLARGVTSLDVARARVAEAPHDVRARWTLIQRLTSDGVSEEGVEHLAWFWQHALEHEPAFVGVRGSYCVELIARLSKRSAAVHERFDAIRRTDVDRVGPTATPSEVSDYLALSIALDRHDDVDAWMDRASPELLSRRELQPVIALRLEPYLEAEGRRREIARLHPQPHRTFEWETAALQQLRELPAELRARMPDIESDAGRRGARRITQLIESLELAGREDEAISLRDALSRSPLATYLEDADAE